MESLTRGNDDSPALRLAEPTRKNMAPLPRAAHCNVSGPSLDRACGPVGPRPRFSRSVTSPPGSSYWGEDCPDDLVSTRVGRT